MHIPKRISRDNFFHFLLCFIRIFDLVVIALMRDCLILYNFCKLLVSKLIISMFLRDCLILNLALFSIFPRDYLTLNLTSFAVLSRKSVASMFPLGYSLWESRILEMLSCWAFNVPQWTIKCFAVECLDIVKLIYWPNIFFWEKSVLNWNRWIKNRTVPISQAPLQKECISGK